MRKLTYLFLVLFVWGCIKSERPNSSERVYLKSKDLNFTESLGKAYAIDILDKYLVVRDDQAETKLTIFNLESDFKNPIYTGYTGQGPGELINPGPMIIESQKFLLYDASKMKLFSFYMDTLMVPDYKPHEAISIMEAGIIDVKKIGKDLFIAVGVFPDNRFALINSQGETIERLGMYPIELQEGVPEYVRGIACQSMLTTNPKKNKAAVAMRYGEHIQFHVFDLDKYTAELINEHHVFLPEYTTKNYNGSPNFSPTEETRWGYLSISSNSNHVYALYSGKPQIRGTNFYQGHEVHVFGWDGELINKIELDKQAFSVTCNEHHLYALYEGENGYEIAEYEL